MKKSIFTTDSSTVSMLGLGNTTFAKRCNKGNGHTSRLFMIALTLLLFVPALVSWGQTTETVDAAKVTASSFTWTNTNSISWAGTVDGGAVNQNVTNGYAQIGTSKNPSTSITLNSSSFSSMTITEVVINCASYSGLGTVSATVGGNAFGTQSQSIPSWSSNSGGNVTFSGSASGAIEITMTNGTNGRAMYIKSISVTYTTSGTPTTVTIDDSGITNTNLFAGSAAGSLSATVMAGDTPVQGATVTWESSNTGVATITNTGEVTLVAAGTTTITASYAGDETHASSSNTYTLTVTNDDPNTQWVLTNFADLTPADVFVIVGDNGDTYALPSTGTSSTPTAQAITVNNNVLSANPAASLQWNLCLTSKGYVFYPAGDNTMWLNCTNSNNGVRVSNTSNNAKHFTMAENGYLTTTETNDQRYLGIYNSSDWRTYTSVTGSSNIAGQTFSFFKKVSSEVEHEMNIVAYQSDENGWYLIASPVASVTPSLANSFLANTYDLFRFNQSAVNEWENYVNHSFDIVSGKGYLYANSGDVTLTFAGQPYNGNGVVALSYDAEASFAGWNLVGNPFGTFAELDANHDFYIMNGDHNEIITGEERTIEAMQGVFVLAADADDESVTFTPVASSASAGIGASIVMNVAQNRGNVIDRAIVRFNESRQLPKFMLNNSNTKLYIQQGDKDYAIASAAMQGEMPVSFKARENGTYTITVSPKDVEVSYLHLIDNMTGMDVDLLVTPSYTFSANANDYTSRFRLMFSATGVNENATEQSFAYISNGQIVLTETSDNATLQVLDMMGRTVVESQVKASISTSSMAPGVYVLRLTNGSEVRIQKIVIE